MLGYAAACDNRTGATVESGAVAHQADGLPASRPVAGLGRTGLNRLSLNTAK